MVYFMSLMLSTTSILAENKNPKVAVIGAGLAGLTAAHRLQQEGRDVDLYEARNRVGGRVFTVKINGHIGELGAQNITDGGEALHLYRLINEFGLEVNESRVNLNLCYFNGKDFLPVDQLLRNKQFNPSILRARIHELAATSHNMKDILDGLMEKSDPLYKVSAVRLAAYEGAPPEKLSLFYIETLFHTLLGGISSVHQGNGEEETYANVASIKGGNALLPEKIAESLGPHIHLNKVLTKVAKDREGLFLLTFQDGQEVKVDQLVLAIPCSVYEDIHFEETVIPFDRLKAIQSVQYGTNAKILIPFSTCPSKRRGIINDQIVSFFEPIHQILTIYYTGATSLFSKETISKAYFQAKPMLEMGFEEDYPSFVHPIFAEDRSSAIYQNPVGYSWPNDPYAKGSYSYISPGQENVLTDISEEKGEKFKTLFTPIDNLYFAGEHTSILLEVPGTMEAACESGERVARAILKTH